MKKLAPLAALALFAAPAAAQDIANPDALGTWAGQLETPAGNLTVVFALSDEDGDGVIEGVGYSPNQGGSEIPIEAVALDSNVLTVNIPVVGASYEGTWNGEAFVGTFSQGGGTLPLTLEATDWKPGDPAPSADADAPED